MRIFSEIAKHNMSVGQRKRFLSHISTDVIRDIRLLHRLGHKTSQIHQKYPNIGKCSIRDIIKGRSYSYVI